MAAHRMGRTLVLSNWNVPFIAACVVLAVGTGVLGLAGVDPYLLGTLYGFAALALIIWRLGQWFRDTPVLVHVLAIMFCAYLLLASIAGVLIQRSSDPSSFVLATTWPSVYLKLAGVVIGVLWPRWATLHESPFRKAPR
jgi:hypothetical protein